MKPKSVRKSAAATFPLLAFAVCIGVWWLAPRIRQVQLDAALIEKIKEGDITSVHALLKEGADPNACDTSTPVWQRAARQFGLDLHPRHSLPRALHTALYAINENHVSADRAYQILVTLLDAGANVETKARDGDTPLMVATWTYDPKTGAYDPRFLDLLLERGADVNARNGYGVTPIMRAGDNPALIRLLAAREADINAQDDYGCTPLHHYISSGHEEGVRALLDLGANVNLRDYGHVSPLAKARSYPYPRFKKMAKTLKNAGAKE